MGGEKKNFAASKGWHNHGNVGTPAPLTTAPRPATTKSPPVVAGHTLPAWQRERARRLHRNFESITKRIEEGQTLVRAVGWYAWYYRTTRIFYLSEPSRRIRFSGKTLVRLYYAWLSRGKSPDALQLRYRSRQKIARKHLARFAKTCLKPGVKSFRAAHESRNWIATASAFRHALPANTLRELAGLFALRRRVTRVEASAKQIIAKEGI